MINIIVSSDPRYKVNKAAVEEAVLRVLQNNRVLGKIEVGINIIGDRKMHQLNKQYRGIDQTTDVLSFALEDPASTETALISRSGFIASPDKWLRLGDIIISYPQAVEDASYDCIPVDEEINFLVEHGVNHLLGIHH